MKRAYLPIPSVPEKRLYSELPLDISRISSSRLGKLLADAREEYVTDMRQAQNTSDIHYQYTVFEKAILFTLKERDAALKSVSRKVKDFEDDGK